MNEMIEAKYFTIGEKFYFKNTDKYIILESDNKVIYEGNQTDMHSAAALVSGRKANRLNGWEYWYAVRNNNFVSINEIRHKYIKDMGLA